MSKGLQAVLDEVGGTRPWVRPVGGPIKTTQLLENDGSLIISPLTLFTCLQWTKAWSDRAELGVGDERNLRNALAHQVQEVCRVSWLTF